MKKREKAKLPVLRLSEDTGLVARQQRGSWARLGRRSTLLGKERQGKGVGGGSCKEKKYGDDIKTKGRRDRGKKFFLKRTGRKKAEFASVRLVLRPQWNLA